MFVVCWFVVCDLLFVVVYSLLMVGCRSLFVARRLTCGFWLLIVSCLLMVWSLSVVCQFWFDVRCLFLLCVVRWSLLVVR